LVLGKGALVSGSTSRPPRVVLTPGPRDRKKYVGGEQKIKILVKF